MSVFGRQMALFAFVGVIGFIVDCSILAICIIAGFDPYSGRLISFSFAVAVTWTLNSRLTFRDTDRPVRLRNAVLYFTVQTFGMAINYSVYALIIHQGLYGWLMPYFALLAGSAVAMIFNYFASKCFVFRRTRY